MEVWVEGREIEAGRLMKANSVMLGGPEWDLPWGPVKKKKKKRERELHFPPKMFSPKLSSALIP